MYATPLELKGYSPKEAAVVAKDYIKKVDLPDTVYHRFPNMLSGGEHSGSRLPALWPAAPR